jgi:type I restriction enzyme S subunit
MSDAPWTHKPLSTVLSGIDAGWSPKCDSRPAAGIEWGVLKVSAVTWGRFWPSENKRLSPELEPRPEIEVFPGDLVLSRANTPELVGRAVLVKETPPRLMLSDKLLRLRINPALASEEFLNHVLASPGCRKAIADAATGSSRSMKNISQDKLRDLVVPLPPLPEQRRIAAILSSVDDVIEKTETVVDQLQVVKKAMMQELLTRGLPGRHTRFKMTEVGEMPASWETPLLDSVAKRGSGHTPDKKRPEYWDGGIKWVSLKDSDRLDRVYIDETTAKITSEGIANSSAVEHPAGTVVLSRDAGVGKSAITTDVMAVSQHFMAWRCGPRLHNHFLYYWLQLRKPEFERIAIGNTIKTIGLPYFKSLPVPLPPMEEQRQIADTLLSEDERIFAEEDVLDKLRTVKRALASVLLSGDVRVNIDAEVAA